MVTAENEIKSASLVKRVLAYLIDVGAIAILGIIVFLPFSKKMVDLGANDWMAYVVVGIAYFVLFESVFFEYQTIGRNLTAIRLVTLSGDPLLARYAMLRCVMFGLPLYYRQIFSFMARSIGITDTFVGGCLFLIVVGVLLVGNTVFLVFHEHKRGLHDVLCGTIMVNEPAPASLRSPAFPAAASVAGVIALAFWLSFFDSTMGIVGVDRDFADIKALNGRVKAASPVKTVSLAYQKFTVDHHLKWLAIKADVFLASAQSTEEYRKKSCDKLFAVIKAKNTNAKVTRVIIIYHAISYLGAYSTQTMATCAKEIPVGIKS